jgi:large subunit ribosomal protein L21
MFAVIKTGGKQYRVAAEDVLQIDKVKGDPGEIIQFGEVLLLGGDEVKLGLPTVAGASVAAEVLEQGRGPKIIAFKKRRRKNSRRKRGHRQEFTLVRVTEILTDGATPTKSAAPKAARPKAAKPESAEAESAETESAEPKSAKAKSAKAKSAKPKAAKPKAKPKAAKPKRAAAPKAGEGRGRR